MMNLSIPHSIAVARQVPVPFSMAIFPVEKDIFISAAIASGRAWDADIVSLLLWVYTFTQGAFVDCGANIGYFSLISASLGKNVVAFEPVPRNAKLFSASITLNQWDNRITLIRSGVSNKREELAVVGNSMNQGAIALFPLFTQKAHLHVSTVIIDNVLEVWDLGKIAAVKLDVEGFEGRAVLGMKELLTAERVAFVIMEVSSRTRETAAWPIAVHLLWSLGYTARDVIDFPPENFEPIRSVISASPQNIYWAVTADDSVDWEDDKSR